MLINRSSSLFAALGDLQDLQLATPNLPHFKRYGVQVRLYLLTRFPALMKIAAQRAWMCWCRRCRSIASGSRPCRSTARCSFSPFAMTLTLSWRTVAVRSISRREHTLSVDLLRRQAFLLVSCRATLYTSSWATGSTAALCSQAMLRCVC